MTRRTKDERRRDYLDIGVELVAEGASDQPDPGLALAHVRIADVAERAGVTKGALYHLWDSQEAYWHDLLGFLLDERRLAGVADVPDVSARLTRELDGLPTVSEWANAVFDHFKDEPTFFARVGIFAYLQDEETRAGLAQEHAAALDRFEAMTADYVGTLGRRARTGATIRSFSLAVTALLQGLCLEHRVDPARTPDVPGDERTSLFAVGVMALLEAFTEPDPDAEPHRAAATGEAVG
jgi:AcrR family transcriptional regulator